MARSVRNTPPTPTYTPDRIEEDLERVLTGRFDQISPDSLVLKTGMLETDLYQEHLVGIDQFVDDPRYLGAFFAEYDEEVGGFNRYWRGRMRRLYPTPMYSPYWLVAFQGSIGRGKTTAVCTGMAYDLYRVLCLYNPQAKFGLAPFSKIMFAIFNVTLGLARSDIWDTLQMMFAQSPWFRARMNLNRWQGKKRDETLFPNRVDIFIGSRMTHAMGKNVFEAALDESDFEIVTGQVFKNFNGLLRRMQTRFLKAGSDELPGRVWVASSEGEKFSVINRIITSYSDKRGIFIDRGPIWQVMKHRFDMTDTFQVYTGSPTTPPRVVAGDDDPILTDTEGGRIIKVPASLRNSFEANIYDSLRDLAGVPVVGKYKLFSQRDLLNKALTVQPVFPSIVELEFGDKDDLIQNHALRRGYLHNPLEEHKPRHIHIDVALSGDRLGFASSFIAKFDERTITDPMTQEEVSEVLPSMVTEFGFALQARPGQQIPLYKVRAFIAFLMANGFIIAHVSCDLGSGLGAEMLQQLKLMGLNVAALSVDKQPTRSTSQTRTPKTVAAMRGMPYVTFRNTVYESRWAGPNDPLLRSELENLEMSPDGRVVDHPVDRMENPVTIALPSRRLVNEQPSKDYGDAVCGSVVTLAERAGDYVMAYLEPTSRHDQSMERLAEAFWGPNKPWMRRGRGGL